MREHIAIWDWRLFAFILLFLALPGGYQLYRVHLIGNAIPDASALAIVAQWQFINLAIEVFQEATVLAIYFFVGSRISSGVSVQLDRLKSILLFILVVSAIFSAAVFLFRDGFAEIVDTPASIRTETVEFLGITALGTPFVLLYAASMVILQALNRKGIILAMAVLNILLRFALDSLFFGSHDFSLDVGVIGVAWSSLIGSALLFAIGGCTLLATMKVSTKALSAAPTFREMQTYLRVGVGSGIDSLVRNLAYFYMIIRIVNSMGEKEIGGYYLAMQTFWSFMLLPVLAFADSARALIANSSGEMARVRMLWRTSLLVVCAMMALWLLFTPFWGTAARALNSDETTLTYAKTAFSILLVPYMLFSFNTVTDSLFYGLGKTRYVAYQSIVTNGTVYLVAFALYATDVWQPSFEDVMMLFALGILVDSILTMLFAIKALYLDAVR